MSNIKYAGVRASSNGVKPNSFFTAEQWKDVMNEMTKYFPGSKMTTIWLVGEVDSDTSGMILEFPSEGKEYELLTFRDEDMHESYLNYFDTAGIEVYLQVEPGFANVNTLIDLVLSRYKHHSCVKGLCIDVEFYKKYKKDDINERVTDQVAQQWEQKVKEYDSSYKLVLKHFAKSNLCPNYRGDIVFVDDTQDFNNIDVFKQEMSDFANTFYPNIVMYQIGYSKDEKWWSQCENPPKDIGEVLGELTEQECGILWVDFTLAQVFPNILC